VEDQFPDLRKINILRSGKFFHRRATVASAPRRVPGRANLFAQMGNPLVGPAAPMVNFAP
jgi:hypothetical protein